jgi:pyrimidine deaminase RibD-like protein
MDGEEDFMRRALDLAERGRGRVMPNPLVGCVLVRDGSVIAEGWHDHIGGLHAEQMAIADAEARGISTTGATAQTQSYLTLCFGSEEWNLLFNVHNDAVPAVLQHKR